MLYEEEQKQRYTMKRLSGVNIQPVEVFPFALEQLPLPSLVARIDLLLLGVRWTVILALGVLSWVVRNSSTPVGLPGAIWFIVVAYNIPLSVHIYRTRPVLHRRAEWLLLGDLPQAFLGVLLTGGYRSFYFFLFLLAAVELALIVKWDTAFLLLLGMGALEALAMSWNVTIKQNPEATYLFVGKFTVTLLVGGIAILLGELIRREMSAQLAATQRARRLDLLFRTSQRMAESRLDTHTILEAILTGLTFIPHLAYALILLPGTQENIWTVGASTTSLHPPGESLNWSFHAEEGDHIHLYGMCIRRDLPAFGYQDRVRILAGIPLKTPDREILGMLLLAWKRCYIVNEEEKLFLLSLAQEAGLGLRNARLYAQEQEHLQKLRRFQELQSTFFSAMGHELKTPLSVLKMLVLAFRQWENIPPKTREETLHTIEQNLTRLERLINDILQGARLEAGAVSPYVEPLDMVRLIEQAVEEVRLLARDKYIHLRSDLSSSSPEVRIYGDRRLLREVLVNLLVNAIKFSPDGSDVILHLEPRRDNLLVCVEDEGPGVPEEAKEHIFDKFYTATSNRALAGTGLGLYISKEIIRLHKGCIWVEDREGGGSRFCFEMPTRGLIPQHPGAIDKEG